MLDHSISILVVLLAINGSAVESSWVLPSIPTSCDWIGYELVGNKDTESKFEGSEIDCFGLVREPWTYYTNTRKCDWWVYETPVKAIRNSNAMCGFHSYNNGGTYNFEGLPDPHVCHWDKIEIKIKDESDLKVVKNVVMDWDCSELLKKDPNYKAWTHHPISSECHLFRKRAKLIPYEKKMARSGIIASRNGGKCEFELEDIADYQKDLCNLKYVVPYKYNPPTHSYNSVPTKAECWTKCSKTDGCLTYAHNPTDNVCQTYNEEISGYKFDSQFTTGFMTCEEPGLGRCRKWGGDLVECPGELGPCYVRGYGITGCKAHDRNIGAHTHRWYLLNHGVNQALRVCRDYCLKLKDCEFWQLSTLPSKRRHCQTAYDCKKAKLIKDPRTSGTYIPNGYIDEDYYFGQSTC